MKYIYLLYGFLYSFRVPLKLKSKFMMTGDFIFSTPFPTNTSLRVFYVSFVSISNNTSEFNYERVTILRNRYVLVDTKGPCLSLTIGMFTSMENFYIHLY